MSGLSLPSPGPLAARPRGLVCPPLTRQARAGRSRPLPRPRLVFPHLLPSSPGARRTARGAGGARAPLLRLPPRRWRWARRRLRRRLQREELSAAGPKAGRRGPRRRGPAPTLRAPPGELRPTGPPRTRLGPGWGRGPCPERHSYVFAPLGARCGRECPRAGAGLRERPRAPRTRGGGADVRTVCACAGTRVPAASASQSLLLEIPPG